MSNPKFEAAVTFECIDASRKWARYKVSDEKRGHLGFFRLNVETRYIDEHDEEGELQLSDFFAKTESASEFLDRFELLNWIFEVLGGFFQEEELPSYRYVST